MSEEKSTRDSNDGAGPVLFILIIVAFGFGGMLLAAGYWYGSSRAEIDQASVERCTQLGGFFTRDHDDHITCEFRCEEIEPQFVLK